jgi:thioredoxin 2
MTEEARKGRPVTLRCSFCAALNKVDLTKASNRPKCGECSKPMLLDRPVKVAQEDFERTVLGAAAPVLVDFYADWCAPCKMVAPLMDEIAHQRVGEMLVAKVDTDRAQDIAMRYGIRSIPTLILFHEGEEKERSVGFEPERVRQLVEHAVS